MHYAFCEALTEYGKAIVIGCDCPSLVNDDLEQALIQLTQGKQCVLTPAEDGGYVLIGLGYEQPGLFNDMPWSTNQVLEITRARIKSLNLHYHEFTPKCDVDTMEDLTRYRNSI
jgi:uncharacterized protein